MACRMRIETRFFDLVRAVRIRIGPSKVPSKFFGSHGTEPVSAGVDHQRRVVDDGGRREALFQRCRIDERLEAGARAGATPASRD